MRLFCLCTVITSLSLAGTGFAHPGNTAADGAHYCWTNCASWGEVYGQRHFHGSSEAYYEPEVNYEPEPIPSPPPPAPASTPPPAQPSSLAPSTLVESENSTVSNGWMWWLGGMGIVGLIGWAIGRDTK